MVRGGVPAGLLSLGLGGCRSAGRGGPRGPVVCRSRCRSFVRSLFFLGVSRVCSFLPSLSRFFVRWGGFRRSVVAFGLGPVVGARVGWWLVCGLWSPGGVVALGWRPALVGLGCLVAGGCWSPGSRFRVGVLAVLVLVGGSRSLPAAGVSACSALAGRAAALGWGAVVGCAAGADVSFLSAFVAAGAGPRASVFAVGGPSGSGFLAPSVSVPVVRSVAAAGGSVSWWAGGGPSVPLRGRLSRRSVAAASVPGVGQGFWVVSSPSSRGSLLSASVAAGRGVPVVFLCAGFAPGALSPLPGLAGAWVSCGVLFGLAAVCWVPAQLTLF